MLGTDPAVVGASGGGGANANGPLGGGQAGCNLQAGTLVYGLEGDFDAFRNNPQFSNNTNTLSNGVTPFTLSQSLTTNYIATVRPRIGIAADRNLAYITGGAAFTRVSYTESYVDGAAPAGTGVASLRDRSLAGPPVPAGNTPSPTIGRSGSNICSRCFRPRARSAPSPTPRAEPIHSTVRRTSWSKSPAPA